MNKKILRFVVLLLIVFLSQAQVAAEVIDRIVAVVNNDIITLAQLNKAVKPYRANIESSQGSTEQKKQLMEKLETDMLQQLITRSLTIQQAGKYQINVTDEDVDRSIEDFKKQNNLDQPSLEKGLEAQGMSYKAYRKQVKSELIQSMLINRAVRSKVIITDGDIQAYYDAHKDSFSSGSRKYHLRNILVETQEEILQIQAKLENKASFPVLAKKHSIASNAQDGGDLGVFDINNFSDQIKNSLAELEKGDHSPILSAGNGYQIIYVEDIILEGGGDMASVREKIQDILYREQAEKRFKEWIESLKESAHIKIML